MRTKYRMTFPSDFSLYINRWFLSLVTSNFFKRKHIVLLGTHISINTIRTGYKEFQKPEYILTLNEPLT